MDVQQPARRPLDIAQSEFDGSRKAARMLRSWYPVRTAASIISIISVAVIVHSFIDFFDDIDRKGRTQQRPSLFFSLGPNVFLQVVGVASLVVLILLIVWLLRAASFGRAVGLPGQGTAPRRTPGLAAASFIIPFVGLWWPWQSICDTLPIGHTSRGSVNRWWALFIATGFVSLGGVVLAFIPLGLAVLGFLLLAVLPIAELLALRRMVDEIAAVHEQVAQAAGLPVASS